MNKQRFEQILADYASISEYSRTWSGQYDECLENMGKLMAEDISSSIAFLDNDISEFDWIELKDFLTAIIFETQSRELIDCFCRVQKKYRRASRENKIHDAIQSCYGALRRCNIPF